MSSLITIDRRVLESFLEMGSGYVLDFSNETFEEFVLESVDIEIYSEEYRFKGTSKANRLRAFWKIESDDLVGRLLNALIEYSEDTAQETTEDEQKLAGRCKEIASRLLSGSPSLEDIKQKAHFHDSNHLLEQIHRIEESIETDPSLAIGTAKEMIETCCKTILTEREVEIPAKPDIPKLTKATFKVLSLVPEGVPDTTRGADVIKQLLSNLSTIAHGLAELRGLYGTGHGQHGSTSGLTTRHAKLAVGAASTLAVFLFETHEQTK